MKTINFNFQMLLCYLSIINVLKDLYSIFSLDYLAMSQYL